MLFRAHVVKSSMLHTTNLDVSVLIYCHYKSKYVNTIHIIVIKIVSENVRIIINVNCIVNLVIDLYHIFTSISI